jgi:NADH-quinone oxidoreductase subunit L
MSIYLNLIVVLPFVSAFVIGLLYLMDKDKKIKENLYQVLGVITPVVVTILSFIVAIDSMGKSSDYILQSNLFTWVSIAEFQIELSLMADRLCVVMISFVTFIGTLIHIYATGYMSEDQGFGKFFSYFNFFLGSMLLLVLANNPIIMFIGWELVGLASYLLIGFYFKDSQNITAANKAFIVNRVGDFGFIIGLSILFVSLSGVDFDFMSIKSHIKMVDTTLLSVIGVLLFVGAMGKSAQLPLYVWLPDAMAGPTPVSALIHAATMVTAGVYMVARFAFIYNEIPGVGEFIAMVGIGSALFAAIIACFQSDIKKILAYSTMSQLGYMFVAVGLGAYSSGIFHVFTHAFFKALLFMGAGAIIIAMHHEQNIFKMGNLKKYLPSIFIMMLIATLAISGIPPFAGFFSKDAIINYSFSSGNYFIWILAVITAFLTAFYMFRMLFIVFFSNGDTKHQLYSIGKKMSIPLVILAIGSTFVGFLGANEAYGGSNWFSSFLNLDEEIHHLNYSTEYFLGMINLVVSLAGIFLAYKLFAKELKPLESISIWKQVIIDKFYIDELYDTVFVKSLRRLSVFFNTVFDDKIVDGVIKNSVVSYNAMATKVAKLQNGQVREYAVYIVFGISMLCMVLLIGIGV